MLKGSHWAYDNQKCLYLKRMGTHLNHTMVAYSGWLNKTEYTRHPILLSTHQGSGGADSLLKIETKSAAYFYDIKHADKMTSCIVMTEHNDTTAQKCMMWVRDHFARTTNADAKQRLTECEAKYNSLDCKTEQPKEPKCPALTSILPITTDESDLKSCR
ncbi:uncharacterized protein LOC135374817 [Ornithodoros turicata]|uniref:uncharacterized protein LOC135374817 n=1 Tax=Ornithodoros turicata TaxID=34597 RepID=UPI0031389CB6